MKSYKKYLILSLFLLGLLSTTSSCRTKEGCEVEEFYKKGVNMKRKSHKKSTLFSKKHRKRMKKRHGKTY